MKDLSIRQMSGSSPYESLQFASTTLADNVYLNGDSIYAIAEGSSWTQAQSSAERLGGNLVTINSEEENIYVFKNFGFEDDVAISSGYWIGLTDQVEEGNWKWSSNDISDWTTYGWDLAAGEPNGNGDHVWVKVGFDYPNISYEDYVEVHNKGWEETEKPLWIERGPGWDDTWESGEGTNYGVAEIPFIRRDDSAYVIVEGSTWAEAEGNANLIGGNLVSIDDEEEDQWLNAFLRDYEASRDFKPCAFSYVKYTLDQSKPIPLYVMEEIPDEWMLKENVTLELSNAYWIGKNISGEDWNFFSDEIIQDDLITDYYPYQTPWSNGSESTYNGETAEFNSIQTGKSWEPKAYPAVALPAPDYFYLKVGPGGKEEGVWANTPTSPWESYEDLVRPYADNALYGIAEINLSFLEPAIDFKLNYQLNSSSQTGLSQNAVLGDSIDEAASYVLEITGESLRDGYRVESADVTLDFDTLLFNDIQASDIRIGGAMPIANAVDIDNEAGTIRIAASSLSDLASGGGIDGETVLASINLDFDETSLSAIEKNSDGSLKTNPLSFSLSANVDETVFSKEFVDPAGLLNREIVTLNDLGGYVAVDGQDVTLYEAKVNLAQQGDGLVLGTQRVIGSDATTTNLVRSGDTLTTSAEWLNVGNIQANNLTYEGLYNQNASLVSADFSRGNIASGSFIDGVFVQDARESTVLTTDIKITGEAGNVVDLGDGIVSVKADAEGSDTFSNAGKGSSNLITFKGDLNYDGRVSMKDLAYLNAGAARQELVQSTDENGNVVQVASEASYARDVDADFSGKIDLVDLSILDADWGKTLHTGDEQFQGSADVSWSELDGQGDNSTWNNDSFKDQNAIEAEDSYVGSLESPAAAGVIGADGNTTANDNDITGTEFQDSIAG